MPLSEKQKRNLAVGAGVLTLLALYGLGTAAAADEGDDVDDEFPDPFMPAAGEIEPPLVPSAGEIDRDPLVPAGGKIPAAVVPSAGELVGKFDPVEHESSYPTPGRMYQVKKLDIFGGEYSNRSIAYRALLSAAYAAAINSGMSDGDAKSFAKSIAKNGNLRAQYIDVITCAGVNDAAYATWGYGDKARPGPQGRAIRLQKYHVNNRGRLVAGKSFVRNIRMGNYQTPGDESGLPMDAERADAYEYLYLPGLDFDALLAGEIVVSQWDPPFTWTIEMPDDLVGQTFGCGDGEILLS